MTLTVGSLFSGIGGIDLGLERAGMTVKWQSEIDPYACKVLNKHWPDIPNLGDIKQIDWSTVELVDVIAGGYPCQPFSTAGKRQGENDPRHLWPYFRDAISGIRPRFAILENVRGHLSMGFDRVLADLTEIGYDAEWQIVSAASVGAPHRRERIICVAYPNGTPRQQQREREVSKSNLGRRSKNVAYPNDAGSRTPKCDMGKRGTETTQDWQGNSGTQHGFSGRRADMADATSQRRKESLCTGARIFASSNAWRSSSDGRPLSDWWEVEPNVGRVADGISARLDRLKGLGNAVVPQVAEYVGRLIMQSLT